MTETQCAAPCAAEDDLRLIVDRHARRLDGLEDDVDTLKSGQSAMMERLISIEAQGQERERNRAAQAQDTRNALAALTQQLAEQTGAQRRQNELAEDSLRRWRKLAVVAGLLCTIGAAVGSTLLSDQEVASTIWVQWLHLREPWDMPPPGNAQCRALIWGSSRPCLCARFWRSWALGGIARLTCWQARRWWKVGWYGSGRMVAVPLWACGRWNPQRMMIAGGIFYSTGPLWHPP